MSESVNRGLRTGLRRFVRTRLILPILRAKHPPDYTARGVFYGVLIGLTPTVGVQMAMVLGVWLLVRWLNRSWDFNLVVAVAWTWLTNALTLPPIYYAFFATGQVMLGRWDDLAGYDGFKSQLEWALRPDTTWMESLWAYTASLFDNFGAPMFLGCIPWALLGSWLAYRWSHRFIDRFHRLRRARRAHRMERLRARVAARQQDHAAASDETPKVGSGTG